jgi:hypothetical protein
MMYAIERNDLAVFEAYARAFPKVVYLPLHHSVYPLPQALRRSNVEMVEAIFRCGQNREFPNA